MQAHFSCLVESHAPVGRRWPGSEVGRECVGLRSQREFAIRWPMGRFPFPHDQRNPQLRYPQQANASDVRRAFEAWRREIVTSEGALGFLRTRRPDTPDGVANSTVSEGIAYGMMIAVMMDDQSLFDAFWQYALRWLNANGLMDWYIAPDGSRRLGLGGATDADQDMAWALIMADRQWGTSAALDEPYLSYAQRQVERLWQFEVDHESYPGMLLPGDEWRGKNVFNPSYFAPSQYRLFGQVSGNEEGWQTVIDRGYAIINRALDAAGDARSFGLVPAWCTDDGNPTEAFPGAMTNYQYDSARTPFRIVQHWACDGDERAQQYLQKVIGFFERVGADEIVDGYQLDGTPAPDPHSLRPTDSAVFVGSVGAGAMYDVRFESLLEGCYSRVRTGTLLTRSRYYNHCWTVLSLLMMSGNFVEFPP